MPDFTKTLSDGRVVSYSAPREMSEAELLSGMQALPPDAIDKASGTVSQAPPKTLAGFMANIPKSAGRAIGGIASAVAHPIDTVGNLANVGIGAAQKVAPELLGTDKQKFADAIGQFYKDRYGGVQNIKDTAYNDPTGLLLDVAGVASGGGAALEGAGALSGIESASQAGRVLSRVGTLGMPELSRAAGGRALRGAPQVAQYPGFDLPQRMIDEGIVAGTAGGTAKAADKASALNQTAQVALDAADASGTKGLPVRGPGGRMQPGPSVPDPALLQQAIDAGRTAQQGQVLSDAVGAVQPAAGAGSSSVARLAKIVGQHPLASTGLGLAASGAVEKAIEALSRTGPLGMVGAGAAGLGLAGKAMFDSPAAMSRIAILLDRLSPGMKYAALAQMLGQENETSRSAEPSTPQR